MVGVMCRAMNLDHPWGRARNGGVVCRDMSLDHPCGRARNGGGNVHGYEFGTPMG